VLWAWHAPPLYQLAIESPAVHLAEHASFLGTGLLFWWSVLPTSRSSRTRAGIGFLSTFALTLQMGVLGALMTFAPTPWYPIYEDRTLPWGLTALEDQQLAGILMWVLGGMIYALVALGLLALAIRAPRPMPTPKRAAL
jgi:putative membrane protein